MGGDEVKIIGYILYAVLLAAMGYAMFIAVIEYQVKNVPLVVTVAEFGITIALGLLFYIWIKRNLFGES